jgi:hypothetical protein
MSAAPMMGLLNAVAMCELWWSVTIVRPKL